MLQNLQNLFFPVLCVACKNPMLESEFMICMHCQTNLPKAELGFANSLEGMARFNNVPNIRQVLGYYKYVKGNNVRRILHEIKYRNNPELGKLMGRHFGQYLKEKLTDKIDLLVPVPLFAGKLAQRGFNQSEIIAEGMAEVLNIELAKNVVMRQKNTQTQTKMSRMNRFLNVDEVFVVPDPNKIKGKNIALVDDVLTTGATLEVCAEAIYKAGAAKISILALAIAE